MVYLGCLIGKDCLAATNLPAPLRSAAYSSHRNLILPVLQVVLYIHKKIQHGPHYSGIWHMSAQGTIAIASFMGLPE